MLTLTDPHDVQAVQDPEVQALLARRFVEIADGEQYDPAVFGYFLLVQPGDTPDTIESSTGIRLPDAPGDLPEWECCVEHPGCFEAVFVLDDSGYGLVLLVPKHPQTDARLLGLCSAYAVPEPATP